MINWHARSSDIAGMRVDAYLDGRPLLAWRHYRRLKPTQSHPDSAVSGGGPPPPQYELIVEPVVGIAGPTGLRYVQLKSGQELSSTALAAVAATDGGGAVAVATGLSFIDSNVAAPALDHLETETCDGGGDGNQ